MTYKFLEHTADLKILVEEKSLAGAFKTSAMALREAMLEKITVETIVTKYIKVESEDLQDLLYKFLEEFLFLLDAEDFIVSKIERIEIADNGNNGYVLRSRIVGDKASKYKFTNSVKAITFNEMFVKKQKDKFRIQFVLDV